MYRRLNLDREIPGHDGDVDPFYRNTLNKSIIDSWWTKLFPDAFENDIDDVVARLTETGFRNLFEVAADDDLTFAKGNVNSYTATCLWLRNKIHNGGARPRETGVYSVYSVYNVDRGLYVISKSMVEVLERYFEESCDLHCFENDVV